MFSLRPVEYDVYFATMELNWDHNVHINSRKKLDKKLTLILSNEIFMKINKKIEKKSDIRFDKSTLIN